MAVAGLDLGDVRLVLAEPQGQLCLFEMSFLADVLELLGELLVFFGEAGFLHGISIDKNILCWNIILYLNIPQRNPKPLSESLTF